MADVEITFSADLSLVRQQLKDFASEVDRSPILLKMGASAGGAASGSASASPVVSAQNAASAMPGAMAAYTGGAPVGGGGGSSAAVMQAGNELAGAIRSVSMQLRTNYSNSGGGGGSGPADWINIPNGRASALAGGGMGGGGQRLLSGPAGSGGGGGGGGVIPVQVARVIAAGGGGGNRGGGGGGGGGYDDEEGGFFAQQNNFTQNNVYGSGGGGSGRGGEKASKGKGLSALRGALYGYGIHEGYSAWRTNQTNGTMAAFASTPTESLDAEIATAQAATSGPFGTAVGMFGDFADKVGDSKWLGFVFPTAFVASKLGMSGPTKVMQSAIEAKARLTAVDQRGRTMLEARNDQRSRDYGPGEYSQRAAGILNTFDTEQYQAAQELSDASNTKDEDMRKLRMKTAHMKMDASKDRREYSATQLRADAEDYMSGNQDSAAVARGQMNQTTLGRNRIDRELARQVNPDQRRITETERDAYDANEGYRIWQREWSAGTDRDVAKLQFDRKPSMAKIESVYNSGIAQSEDAKRSGSSAEADLIMQRTKYQLAGFGRDLMAGGSTFTTSDPMSVDFGQAGVTGKSSYHEGDDSAEAIKKIQDILGDFVDWAKENL